MSENFQFLFSSLQRLSNFPLDSTSIFKTRDDLHKYIAENKTIYEGQIVAVLDEENVFVLLIDREKSSLNKTVFFEKRVGFSEEEIRSFAKEEAENLDKILEASLLAKITEVQATLESEIREIKEDISTFKGTVEKTYATKEDVEAKYTELSEELESQSSKISNLENITKDIKENTIRNISSNISEVRKDLDEFKESVPKTYATIETTDTLQKNIQATNKLINDVSKLQTEALESTKNNLIGQINNANTEINTLSTKIDNTNSRFDIYETNTNKAIEQNKKAIDDHKKEFEEHTESINTTLTQITNELNGRINELVDELDSEYYTKSEVDNEIQSAVSKVNNLIFEVINNKNQITKTGIIYLYRPDPSTDFYEQWIYDVKLGATKIGTTAADFSKFVTKEELSNAANTLRNETQEIKKAIDADIKAYKNEINAKQELVSANVEDIQKDLTTEIERSKEVDRILESKLLNQNNTISNLRSDVDSRINYVNSRIDSHKLLFDELDLRFARAESDIDTIQDTYASKTFVTELVGKQKHLTTKVITDLSQIIYPDVIYLYRENESDFYEQWIYDSESGKPINIGTTNANLDGYTTDEEFKAGIRTVTKEIDALKVSNTITDNKITAINEAIGSLNTVTSKNKADIANLNLTLTNKISDTKAEIKTFVSDEVNKLNSSINTVDDKFKNYYTSEEVSREINKAVSSNIHLRTEIVDSVSDVKVPNVIYLIKDERSDNYAQWIYDTEKGPIQIGSTAPDLSNFVTKDLLNTEKTSLLEVINTNNAQINSEIENIKKDLSIETERSEAFEETITTSLNDFRTDAYSKLAEIDTKILKLSNLTHLEIKVVENLEEITETNIIYLFKSENDDFYEQWILDPVTRTPINIGTTNANLDGYATDEDVDVLKNRITLLEEILQNYNPGNGGSCDCEGLTPMEPYSPEDIEKEFKNIIGECSGVQDNEDVFERVTEGAIENLFNEINEDCDGVEDTEEVIESIPLDDIESTFNEINNTCDGVEDDIEITEGISQNDIEDLFNSINRC